MLSGIRSKALLIGTMAVSILISERGEKKDSDDKVMLEIGDNITEVTSDGQKNLLDISNNKATYWQYDSGNNLLIASSKYYTTNVSIYNLETGAETDIGFPEVDDSHSLIEYEGQEMYGLNAWYEDGKVNIYAQDSDDRTLVVFTFDCENGELVDTARYDIESPVFVRDAGNFIVYVKNVNVKHQDGKYYIKYELDIFDKTTGENRTVASDIGKIGKGIDLIVLNGDKSKVLFAKTKDNCSQVNWLDIEDDTPVLCEYDIPSGETREVYKCSKGNYITGFTYALGSNKIYLRYGKRFSGLFDFYCQPNYTTVITTDGRDYELHSSLIDGYNMNTTGLVELS